MKISYMKKGLSGFMSIAMVLTLLFSAALMPRDAAALSFTAEFNRIVEVQGITAGGVQFTGALHLMHFTTNGTTLAVQGLLTGSFDTFGHVTNMLVTFPVRVMPDPTNPTDCNFVDVKLGPATLMILGKPVRMSPVTLLLEGMNPPSPTTVASFSRLVCSLSAHNLSALTLNLILALYP